MMINGPKELYDYCSMHSTPEPEVLQNLSRKTNLEIPMPIMLSGHIQGSFLEFLCKMFQPKNVLEVGTYTAYSAIYMAGALPAEGVIHTIDNNPYIEEIQKEYVEKAELSEKIKLHQGDAADIIPSIDLEFDMAFIDADKINYHKYYDLIMPKLKSGGLIVADNVLYAHEVLNAAEASRNGKAMHDFNNKVLNDTHVDNLLLPLLDGLMLIRKK